MTKPSQLRQAAEARLAQMPDNASELTPQATQQTLYELRVHQIELEMQNEELRRAQVELADSRARYVDLYDLAPVGYLTVSETGLIVQANLAAATLLGVARAKLVKMPFSRFVLKDDQDVYYLYRKQLFETGAAPACELRLVKPGAPPCWARLESTSAQDDAGTPVAHIALSDVSGRKQVDQTLREWSQILELQVAERTLELRHSEARFRHLAEVTFEGIAISAGGILLDGNPQLAELFGYNLAEMIGRPLTEFLTLESHKWTTRHVSNNSGIPHELIGLRKDGSTFPLEAHARLKTVQGKTTRVAALRDLSMVKQQAFKIQTQQRALEHAHRFALVSEVSTGIIHQLGQPLCAMGINVAAALAGHQACELQPCDSWEILKDIEAGVADMRKIISDLRGLAHPGQPHLVRSDFNDLVEGVLHLLRQEAESHQLLLAVSLGLDLPAVLANPAQLGQVILNLVRNAFDAHADCPPERRTVALLTRALPGAGVELSVRDAGTGIAPAAMPHLFTPFFSTKAQGLGIGLRLCQTIVETHGGRIEGSNNADGIGATFRVVIPAIQQ